MFIQLISKLSLDVPIVHEEYHFKNSCKTFNIYLSRFLSQKQLNISHGPKWFFIIWLHPICSIKFIKI